MIRSEKQYEASKKQLASLKQGLSAENRTKTPDAVIKAARGQTTELAAEIEKQIKDYEELQKKPPKVLQIHSLDDLRIAPIRYRIAAHMTVESFAQLVQVHSRQIARYESEDYKNVSWETLLKILEHLNVEIEGRVDLSRKIAT